MRILFADDSMTAQNMGKKILTEAGYDVVAVSNGAAAVKKIAEHKPDIIILDIYMPGYTGLEVCDKVRGSADTLRTPVLLTVGKMEPYRAEDANRVKADGVIIKPFEASDLLAVIKKLEERVIPKTVAITEQTVVLDRPPAFAEFPQAGEEDPKEAVLEVGETTVQATVDVPDNMATAAAFSDLLGTDPAHSFDSMPLSAHVHPAELPVVPDQAIEPSASTENTGAVLDDADTSQFTTLTVQDVPADMLERTSVTEPEPAASVSFATPDFNVEVEGAAPTPATSGRAEDEAAQSVPVSAEDFVAAEPSAELNIETEVASLPVVTVPFIVEPETVPAASSPSIAADGEAAAPPPVKEVSEAISVNEQSSPETEPSPVFAAATLPAPEAPPPSFIDPGLETHAVDFDSFSAKVEAQIQQIEAIVSASEARHVDAEIHSPVDTSFGSPELNVEAAPVRAAEDDFEARVAAAMSAYDLPAEIEGHAQPAPQVHDAGAEFSTAEAASHETPEPVAEPVAFEAPYSFEYSPPIVSPEAAPSVETEVSAAKPEELEEVFHAPVEAPVHVEPADAVQEVASQVAGESPVASHEEAPNAWQQAPAVQPEEARFDEETIISEIAAQLPAAPAAGAGEPGGETQMIASAVHRVLERLKPQLIEEISRELKSSKPPGEK